jgi:hypothetical protein
MDRQSPPTWHGHSHFWECPLGRRQLMKTVAGAAGLGLVSGLSLPRLAFAQAGSGVPKPIPGGVSPLGIPIHHFPLPAAGTPLSQLSEPSEITDFNGFIGGTRIRGAGIGTGFSQPLAFQTDMGFMQGEFVGEDGEHHNATFVFI